MTNSPPTSPSSGTLQPEPLQLGPPAKSVWPCLVFDDCRAAIEFLVRAFGFVSTATHASESDDAVIVHAELRWPEGGGIMCGSPDRDDSEFSKQPIGSGSLYVVTDHPDEVCERALACGAELVRGLRDEDYGSRGFTVRDPEGNLWSFGTYAGE